MKKLILILAIVGFAITVNGQAHSEITTDSVIITTSWYVVSGTVDYQRDFLKLKYKKVAETYVSGEFDSKEVVKSHVTYNENDTLFKIKNGNFKDTFLIKPIYDKMKFDNMELLLRKHLKYKLKTE